MVFGVAFADADVESRVRGGIDATERLLSQAAQDAEPFVAQAASHLLDAGGKRFRPLLTMLAAELDGNCSVPDVARAAAVVELTHLATLYHDDVMDEAMVRRGAPSANARWDNSIAILVGDYLFAQASQLVADLGTEAVRVQARTFARLVQGQIRETVGPGDGDPLKHYLDVIADKTGSLIATAAFFGAKFGGVPDARHAAITEFGEHIGIAFQLADDIIDIESDSDESGKTPGTDLREGVPTLPVLFALQSTDPADARLQELISQPLDNDADVAEALKLLRAHQCMQQASQYVHAEAETARTALQDLPANAARTALEDLCTSVVTRIS